MLKRLELKESEYAPYVFMDADEGYVELKGKSFPPDVASFYKPVLSWLEDFKIEGNNKLEVILKLDYFNTASSKLLLDILYKIEEINQQGKDVVVFWYYPDDEEEMLEMGEEYDSLTDIPFQLIGYEKKY